MPLVEVAQLPSGNLGLEGASSLSFSEAPNCKYDRGIVHHSKDKDYVIPEARITVKRFDK